MFRFLSPELIRRLLQASFWRNICQDPELWPEIRKDAITVYYCGGGLLRELRLLNDKLIADVHRKYIPLQPAKASYVRLLEEGAAGMSLVEAPGPLSLGTAGPDILRAYKATMDRISDPEAEIVDAICGRPEKNQIIDQEIAFQESGQRCDRIDLCHFDTALKKLVFVEVKGKNDRRLFRPEGTPEVLDQLAAYCQRLTEHKGELLAAYRKVVAWKRELGLGDRLTQVPNDGPQDLLEKPILVIGDCTTADVQRIKKAEDEWAPLREGLKSVAAGVILCGKAGCRLNLVQGDQVIIF